MSETTKKPSKKSAAYARPQPGTFGLLAFPGVEFEFRKIMVDDEAWAEEQFGVGVYEFASQTRNQVKDLCRLYFHFLKPESQALFKPEEMESTDPETGAVKKELVTGSVKLMRSIQGGSLTELLMMSHAFAKTLAASRPMSELPEDLKKSLEELVLKAKEKAPEANP